MNVIFTQLPPHPMISVQCNCVCKWPWTLFSRSSHPTQPKLWSMSTATVCSSLRESYCHPTPSQPIISVQCNCVCQWTWTLLSLHPALHTPAHHKCAVQLWVRVSMNVIIAIHHPTPPHPTPLHDQCMQVILPCVALESFWWRKWGPLDSQVMRNTVSRSAWDHVQFSPHQLDSCTYLFYPGSAWPPSGCKVGRRCLVTCRNWVRTCFSCLRGPIQL